MTDTIEPDSEPLDSGELDQHFEDLKKRVESEMTKCIACGELGRWGFAMVCQPCKEARQGRQKA